jgi:hypothetical protein
MRLGVYLDSGLLVGTLVLLLQVILQKGKK